MKQVLKFKKNKVYLMRGKKPLKMCCVLVDSEYACLVPISGHRDDSGYKLKHSHCLLFSPEYETSEANILGRIENGDLIYLK